MPARGFSLPRSAWGRMVRSSASRQRTGAESAAPEALGTRSVGTRGAALLLLLLAFCVSGCQQRMAVQPSYKPLDPSTFFADGRSARPIVPGTVARGHLRTDTHLFTGMRQAPESVAEEKAGQPAPGAIGTQEQEIRPGGGASQPPEYANAVDTFPFPITRDVMQHGQERYMIYCVVCHDPLGTGHGKIVERGYTPPPSFHIDRLRKAPVGHLFDVITNGYGSMPDYKQQVPPRDRWAIVAYIRALQLSQHFPLKELSAEMRAEWRETLNARAAGGEP